MTNLANGRVSLNFNNLLYKNFIFNLCMVYQLNDLPRNPTNTFTLTNCLFRTVKLTKNAHKSRSNYNG